MAAALVGMPVEAKKKDKKKKGKDKKGKKKKDKDKNPVDQSAQQGNDAAEQQ